MPDVGQSSSAKPSDEPWAKLVPSDLSLSNVEIRLGEEVICSEIISSSLEKHKWCKITKNGDQSSATILNMSGHVILVNGVDLPIDEEIVINYGSEISAGPEGQGYLAFRFEITIDVEHAKCSICLNVWHDVVTVAPCLHDFCNGCFSEWIRMSQLKHANVLCPQCKGVVQCVGRNHFMNYIEQDILRADPTLRRSDEDIALIESYASIKSNLVLGTSGGRQSRKRARALDGLIPVAEEESRASASTCLQCVSAIGGFSCSQNTAHVQCQACGGFMPSRTDSNVPQHCLGCDRAFCGAYWHSLSVTSSATHRVCSRDTFLPISERTISRIPFLTHNRNRQEQDITERCIQGMGKALQDIISEWTAKFHSRQIDRTLLKLNHAEMISAGTHVCNECSDQFVSFLLYWFRLSLPQNLLPADASERENCWYGYSCRTQFHNVEHAKKRNHVCRPTRGSAV
uniref:RING-type domain-containing protein n=1 Tax=Kalanchoe fedtschenkoi TaxID=63787 RepID=A0A7N0TWX3_KALFE